MTEEKSFEELFPELEDREVDLDSCDPYCGVCLSIGGKDIKDDVYCSDDIKKYCISKQRVKEALQAAVHGVMFKGYDGNSEKALIEMQNYVYKELGLEE